MRDEQADWLQRDREVVWHPFTPTPHLGPRTTFTRAQGAYVFSSDGQRYFDATSSWWCNTLGHCHPRLVRALSEQAATLDQVLFAPHTHPVAVKLAEKLIAALGAPFGKVFYSDDGSTAVEAALKMAMQYWHNRQSPRRRFISVQLGYHGDTLGAVSVSACDAFHGVFESVKLETHVAAAPYCYRCPVGRARPDCGLGCLDATERFLREHGGEVAALVVEPLVLGAGGMIAYPPEYLERLVALCRAHGALIIFDEVFTGFGRTGPMFAMESVSCRPDIVCLSKGLTAGMLPLAATVVTEEVFAAFSGGPAKAFYHGHTFTGNGLGCAVALESLAVLEEERIIQRNRQLERVLGNATARFSVLPHVGEVRHRGLIWALELVTDKASRRVPQPANGPGWKIAERLWQQGVWLRPLHQMVYLLPPYCTTESELQGVLELLYSEVQDESNFQLA